MNVFIRAMYLLSLPRIAGFAAVLISVALMSRPTVAKAAESKNEALQVGLNHLYVAVDEETYKSLAASAFLTNEMSGWAQRSVTAGDGRSWTGIYVHGTKTYLELLPPDEERKAGHCGIALGVDQSGKILQVLDRLALIPNARSGIMLTTRERNSEKIPWFYTAGMSGDSDDLLSAWVMEYHPDYLRRWYPDVRPEDAGVSRANYVARLYKGDRLFKDVVGVTIALPDKESERFLQLLKALGYQVETSEDQRTARGPEMEFIVVPESPKNRGIVEVRWVLSDLNQRDEKHRFGPTSILELRKDKTARWRF